MEKKEITASDLYERIREHIYSSASPLDELYRANHYGEQWVKKFLKLDETINETQMTKIIDWLALDLEDELEAEEEEMDRAIDEGWD
jgi:hypothetical protein